MGFVVIMYNYELIGLIYHLNGLIVISFSVARTFHDREFKISSGICNWLDSDSNDPFVLPLHEKLQNYYKKIREGKSFSIRGFTTG